MSSVHSRPNGPHGAWPMSHFYLPHYPLPMGDDSKYCQSIHSHPPGQSLELLLWPSTPCIKYIWFRKACRCCCGRHHGVLVKGSQNRNLGAVASKTTLLGITPSHTGYKAEWRHWPNTWSSLPLAKNIFRKKMGERKEANKHHSNTGPRGSCVHLGKGAIAACCNAILLP